MGQTPRARVFYHVCTNLFLEVCLRMAEKSANSIFSTVTRIKKIIQLDEDIAQCSHNATFLIAMATVSILICHYFFVNFEKDNNHILSSQELFIQYLAKQGYNVVKSERKPRKTIQYKDLGTHTLYL
jgi:DNA-directed RNA polymerase I subunit RPA43